MGKFTILPEQAEELRLLYAGHSKAIQRAAAALRTSPSGHILEGEALQRAIDADAEVAAIARQIKKILGG
jgi:hypothetical protein